MKNLNEYVSESLVDDKINRNNVDEATIRELTLYAENDRNLFKRYEEITNSLLRKYKRDKDNFVPDEDTLVGSLVVQKLVSDIYNAYNKEFGLSPLSKDDRWAMKEAVTKKILQMYEDEIS